MKLTIVFITIHFLFSTTSYAQSTDETSIRQILISQEKAWNTGNIEGFMLGYWQSDSLVYVGKSGVTYGWQKTLENYKKSYPDTMAMGHLTFDLFELRPLMPGYYFVIGKWHLQRTTGNLTGHFTLLFRKIKSKWVIVADHSS
ncbi:MAG: DUF4440 domain-containing protein [Chitinophagaceae bacterium]